MSVNAFPLSRLGAANGTDLTKPVTAYDAPSSVIALPVAQVNAAIRAGVLTDAVLAAYAYYYGEPYGG